MDKKVYQLFIGKVADEIGMDKCSQLLKESSDSFKESKTLMDYPLLPFLNWQERREYVFGNKAIDILKESQVFSLNKFEQELGMPQGYLSRAINNKRALPKEWEATLKKYLLNLAKNINEKMI